MVDFTLRLDPWGRLVLTDAGGKEHVGVEAVRGFPISDPWHGVALVDGAGRELAWVEDLDRLPAAERALLEEELPRREFMPVMRRVLRVSGVAEPSEWEVETDRGTVKFLLNSEDDVRPLTEGRAMLIDSHGTRYLIPDLESLDPATRRVLERYL